METLTSELYAHARKPNGVVKRKKNAMAKMYGKASHWNWLDDELGPKRVSRRKKQQRATEEKRWQDEAEEEGAFGGADWYYEVYLPSTCPCSKHLNRPDLMMEDYEY